MADFAGSSRNTCGLNQCGSSLCLSPPKDGAPLIPKDKNMPAYFRLQDLTTVTSSRAQDLQFAIDVAAFRSLTIQVRKPNLATTATLIIQHAAVLEEEAFEDTTVTFDLGSGASTPEAKVVIDSNRFLRWKVNLTSGDAGFMIDLLGREN